MAGNDVATVRTLLTARKALFDTTLECLERQWDPKKHRVFDEEYRKKKVVNVPTNKKDPVTGNTIYKSKKVERVRIALPIQKVLVNRAVGFLFGNKVEYKLAQIAQLAQEMQRKPNSQQNRLYNAVMKVFHQNKMRYFDKKLARTIFRCREAAELWYLPTNEHGNIDLQGKMRVKLLSPLEGDKLYPHYDNFDRMDGFAREYVIYDEAGLAVRHFDVYDSRFVYQYVDGAPEGGWQMQGVPKRHGFSKLPIVYYRIEQALWEDVQWAIERVEDLISNWGDTNDYFGTPKYFVKGKILGFAEKGEQGSVFQGEKDTNMNVLSWDSSPVSVSGELANLMSFIFSCSHSADISFERMKEVGNNTSGAAIRLMLIDPHMNAEDQTELFGEMFTRRCNVVANAIVETGIYENGIPASVAQDTEFEPIFKPYMPENQMERLQMITSSAGGQATTSKRRGIELNPLNDDPNRIQQEIEDEQQQALELAAQSMAIGESASSAVARGE